MSESNVSYLGRRQITPEPRSLGRKIRHYLSHGEWLPDPKPFEVDEYALACPWCEQRLQSVATYASEGFRQQEPIISATHFCDKGPLPGTYMVTGHMTMRAGFHG